MNAADYEAEGNNILSLVVKLIINKRRPNLWSRDTSIQGTLSLFLRVSPK